MSAAWWARAGWLVTVALSLAAVPTADAATLRLDARFGDGGIAHVRFGSGQTGTDMSALRPVRQPDGKVLVAAAAHVEHWNSQVLLARFTRSGRPDTTFGHGGREHFGFPWNFEPQAVHVQPDGRILVLGADGYGGHDLYPIRGQVGLARLLPDGSRDRSFGTNGFVAWNPPWGASTDSMVARPGLFVPQADGRVLVAAVVEETRWLGERYTSNLGGFRRVAFVRFNEDGSVDESFGRAGMREELENTPFFFYAWAALPDGDLVTLASRAGPTWGLHRFKPDGTLDRGFGQDGSVPIPLNDPYGVRELVPTRDGGLVLVLRTALRRIRPSGQLDPRFGTTCDRPTPLGAANVGTAATSDGGVLATATRVRTLPRPTRVYHFVFRYGSDGCVAGRPLRLKGVSAGPPLLQRRHTALVGATYNHAHAAAGLDDTLALIRIRR